MKTKISVAQRIFGLLVGFLALSSVALAQHPMPSSGKDDRTKLVRIVRNATKQYLDINKAIAGGYGPFLGCVSGSDHGAMGIHYVNPMLLNGTIDVTQPQALIYEPTNGKMKLVGVEFITDAATWQKVQAVLQRNGRSGGAAVRNKFGALLKGLLHCVPCGRAMTPAHCTKGGKKRYRYYTCTSAQKRGWATCP